MPFWDVPSNKFYEFKIIFVLNLAAKTMSLQKYAKIRKPLFNKAILRCFYTFEYTYNIACVSARFCFR